MRAVGNERQIGNCEELERPDVEQPGAEAQLELVGPHGPWATRARRIQNSSWSSHRTAERGGRAAGTPTQDHGRQHDAPERRALIPPRVAARPLELIAPARQPGATRPAGQRLWCTESVTQAERFGRLADGRGDELGRRPRPGRGMRGSPSSARLLPPGSWQWACALRARLFSGLS